VGTFLPPHLVGGGNQRPLHVGYITVTPTMGEGENAEDQCIAWQFLFDAKVIPRLGSYWGSLY
jgi:hypothetical protein